MSTTHEIVLTPVTTKVRFYTSVDNVSYIPSHWHRAIEIIYIQTGALTVTVESHTQKLTAGQCILINSNVVHSTQCTIPNTAIVFQIPLDFIETYIPQVRSLLFHLPEGSADPKERTKLDIFKNTLEKMQIASDMQPDGFLLRFNSLLFEVLFQLYHSFSTKVMHSDFSKKKKELDRLNPVLQYTTDLHSGDRRCCLPATGLLLSFFQKQHGNHLFGIPERAPSVPYLSGSDHKQGSCQCHTGQTRLYQL